MPKLRNLPEKVKLHDGTEIEVIRTDGSGKIPYLDDSGAEKPGDLIGLLGTLKSTLDEREKLEGRAKTAEAERDAYKALGAAPEDLSKALEMTKALKAGDLKTIEDVRKLQEEAALKERETWKGKVEATEAEANKLKAQIEDAAILQACNKAADLTIKDAMGKEQRVFAAPGDGLHRVYRDHIRRDEKGNIQVSRVPGRFDSSDIILHEFQPAPIEIALLELAKSSQPWLLAKPSGGGSGVDNGGTGGGASIMSRSKFMELHRTAPEKALEFTRSGGKIADDAAA